LAPVFLSDLAPHSRQFSPDATAGGGSATPSSPGIAVADIEGEPIGSISFEHDDQIMVGHWTGHCTPERVVTGLRAGIAQLHQHPCRAVLSDGSGARGDWSDLLSWMQYDLLPQLLTSGVRYVAAVRSADPSGRLAHQDYARFAAQFVNIRLFDDAAQARKWLHERLAEEG
jgi:hypothetical protein